MPPTLKDLDTGETYEIEICKYCDDKPALIYPWDQMAERQPDGSVKCGNCVRRDIADRIVRVTPNSLGAKEIIAEEDRKVKRWNERVARLDKVFGKGVSGLGYKKNRFR
jgi:hypothetical protein